MLFSILAISTKVDYDKLDVDVNVDERFLLCIFFD